MSFVSIKIDEAQLADLRRVLNPKTLKKIQVSALSELSRAGKKLIADEVREVLTLKADKAKVAVGAVVKKDDPPTLTFSIKKKLPRLEDFVGSRVNKAGAVLKGIRGRPAQLIRHAFKMRVQGGAKTVIVKRAEAGKTRGRKLNPAGTAAARLPVRNLFGPSVYELLNQSGSLSAIGAKVLESLKGRYLARLASKADYELNRKGAV
jgi:hypothetical protein